MSARSELARVAQAFGPGVAAAVRALFEGLDEEQAAVVVAWPDGGVTIADALAGSGKTRVCLAAICYWRGLVSMGKAEGNLLVPTFTVEATRELARRVEALLGSSLGVTICTWEHLYRIVLRETGLWSGVMWSREEEIDWLIRHTGARIVERFPRSVNHANLFAVLDRAADLISRGQPMDPEFASIFRPAWEQMRRAAARTGALVEDEVRLRAEANVELIADHLVSAPEWRVRGLINDEFQDDSTGDLVIPLALAARGIPVLCTGDRNQEIMGFRGALGDIEPLFVAAGVRVQRLTIATNYRATVALNRSAEALLRANGSQGPFPRPAPGAKVGSPALHIACGSEEAIARICAGVARSVVGTGPGACAGCGVPEVDAALLGRLEPLGACDPAELLFLVPTNPIGRWLEDALRRRGASAYFAGRARNPYSGEVARLVVAWLEPPSPVSTRSVIPALSKLVRAFVSYGRGADRRARESVASRMLALLSADLERRVEIGSIRDYVGDHWQAVGLELETEREREAHCGILQLFASWQRAEEPRAARLRELVHLLPGLIEREVGELEGTPVVSIDGFVVPEHWPLVCRALLAPEAAEIAPSCVVAERARAFAFAQKTSSASAAVPRQRCAEIRTTHRAKGLTKRVVVAVRADRLGSTGRVLFPALVPNDDVVAAEALRLGYVNLTRAAEVYVELSLGGPNLLHQGRLSDWDYLECT